jgi:hypothetical protein
MAFAALLNDEAHELAKIGVDVIQFDEPAFNVYMKEVTEWGIAALHRAAEGASAKPPSTSAVATALRRISTGRQASGRNGGNDHRHPASDGLTSFGWSHRIRRARARRGDPRRLDG